MRCALVCVLIFSKRRETSVNSSQLHHRLSATRTATMPRCKMQKQQPWRRNSIRAGGCASRDCRTVARALTRSRLRREARESRCDRSNSMTSRNLHRQVPVSRMIGVSIIVRRAVKANTCAMFRSLFVLLVFLFPRITLPRLKIPFPLDSIKSGRALLIAIDNA